MMTYVYFGQVVRFVILTLFVAKFSAGEAPTDEQFKEMDLCRSDAISDDDFMTKACQTIDDDYKGTCAHGLSVLLKSGWQKKDLMGKCIDSDYNTTGCITKHHNIPDKYVKWVIDSNKKKCTYPHDATPTQ